MVHRSAKTGVGSVTIGFNRFNDRLNYRLNDRPDIIQNTHTHTQTHYKTVRIVQLLLQSLTTPALLPHTISRLLCLASRRASRIKANRDLSVTGIVNSRTRLDVRRRGSLTKVP